MPGRNSSLLIYDRAGIFSLFKRAEYFHINDRNISVRAEKFLIRAAPLKKKLKNDQIKFDIIWIKISWQHDKT